MNLPTSRTSERLAEAMERHRAGDLAAAAAGYSDVLAVDPTNFDALHLLGMVALDVGDPRRAVRHFERALESEPAAYPALHHLGLAHQALGNVDEAIASFRAAVAADPGYVPAYESLARLLHGLHRLGEAAVEFGHIARLVPGSAAAHNNLGTTLGRMGRFADALECYERALAVDPLHQDALLNAAQLLARLGRTEEALARYAALLGQRPDRALAYYHAGSLYYAQGMRAEARKAFETALAIDEACAEARWALAMAELPLAYGPNESPGQCRARFDDALVALGEWFAGERVSLGYRAVGNQQPFYLAYQELDNRAILERYGDLCTRLMRAWRPEPPRARSRRVHRKPLRLGIVSAFFYDQSVWTALLRGLCKHFNRDRIEMHLFYPGIVTDAQTALAKAQAASFCTGRSSLEEWVDGIEAQKLDVLLYPEIGMDATSTKLASLRLVPVQVAAWGHPETTGLPTVDYFVSAELFEPDESARHYREKLVLLPNLGCYCEPLAPAAEDLDWKGLGVDDGVPILVCPGTPYKYLPEHDDVLIRIAGRLGRCQFVFFVDQVPRLSRLVEARLVEVFKRQGLRAADFLRFLPRQSRPAFFGVLRRSDAYLDTIGFSGFNTAMQAAECALPIVTCEGRFMRGRLASGVLKRMGLGEIVAVDKDGYVELAVRLCEDAAYRRDVAQRIRSQRHRLWRDRLPVRALEDFLCDVESPT